MQVRNTSRIVTTPESIVREHREEMLRRMNNRFRGVGNTNTLREPSLPAQQQTGPESHLVVSPRPRPDFILSKSGGLCHHLQKCLRAVNWQVAFDYACWAGVILSIAALSGLMFFGPTSWREFWK